MTTVYNIGDEVLIPFIVAEIMITDDGIIYKVKNASERGAVDTLYRKEDEIHGAL